MRAVVCEALAGDFSRIALKVSDQRSPVSRIVAVGTKPAVVAYAYEIRVSLLATNRYLTILPESVLRFPAIDPRIKLVSVELPLRRMPIGVITMKNRTLSPAAQLFIDCAREIAMPFSKRQT